MLQLQEQTWHWYRKKTFGLKHTSLYYIHDRIIIHRFGILTLMELAYTQYVKRLHYEPYQWPPDMSLAELHSRVSEQGPINPSGVKCPCCGFQSKLEFTGWLSRDISDDCRGYGTAIPAFFGLLMYYTLAIFVVICLYSIYSVYAVYYTCDNILITADYSCLKFGLLYYIDFTFQIEVLRAKGDTGIVNKLIILQTITFYFLMGVNLSSLVYLYYMEKKERSELNNRRFNEHALILGNLPETDPEKIKQKLNVLTNLRIVDILPLKEVRKYYDLFHKRNILYYKLMSKYVVSKNPRKEKKLNRKLKQIHSKFLEEKKHFLEASHSKILIFFKRSCERIIVEEEYSLNQIHKIQYGTKQILADVGLTKEELMLPIYVTKVPDVNEIKWENAGQDIRSKLSGRIVTSLIALGIIVLCFFIFYGPISWSLVTHTNNPSHLTTIQKWLPIIISLVLFAISMAYQSYMRQVAKRRFPLSEFQASKFALLASMLFHILFYIVIPVAFFAIPNQIKDTTKLFVIAEQARTFIVLQLIINILDVPYMLWKEKKIKCLSDQREGFKYYQKNLHKIVEFRDFPLEMRIQSMFKIWSFVLFYVFYLPYMVIYMFIALVILYVLEKRNFYLHYALRRAIPLQLEKSFLIYFVNFFGVFQCFSYCYNATYNWMIISAVATTAVLLVANIVFWKCLQPQYTKKKEMEQGMKEKLVEESGNETDYELEEGVRRAAKEYRMSYENFMESMRNDELDDQVDEYIKTLNQDELKLNPQEIEVVQRLIELPESELEDNLE